MGNGLLKVSSVVALFCAGVVLSAAGQTFHAVSFDGTDGSEPYLGSLVQAANGNFYGTTASGGANNLGTIFEVTPKGKLTTVYSFCPVTGCVDGSFPMAGLLLGSNGNLYGTTDTGGTGSLCGTGCGTVFVIASHNQFATLYSFCSLSNCVDGWGPNAGLVQAPDGSFYGTTSSGGQYGQVNGNGGTVFKITPNGTLTTIYSFCAQSGCPDGFQPQANLVLGTNGSLYGTTGAGGANNAGTLFTITRAGVLTTLYSFCSMANCIDGQGHPTLMLANNGDFYGTTSAGGSTGNGTIFKLTPSGVFSTLYNFCTQANCTDGANPTGVLADTNNPNASLFGTTQVGGTGGGGTLFQMTYVGGLTTVHSFCQSSGCSDGSTPMAGIFESTNGNIYGTTASGGSGCGSTGCGTLYSVNGEALPSVQAVPGFGRVGQDIGILGNNLEGTTLVAFGAKQATYKVVSNTLIVATVPADAPTAPIGVQTPTGPLFTRTDFHVFR